MYPSRFTLRHAPLVGAFLIGLVLLACTGGDTTSSVAKSEVSIRIDPTTLNLSIGESATASCSEAISGETQKVTLSWSSSTAVATIVPATSSVATENWAAIFTGVTAGTANFKCSDAKSGKEATLTVVVHAVTGALNPATTNVEAGGTDKVVLASFTNFKGATVAGPATWSTGNPAIATVALQTDGSAKVHGVSAGTTTIRATLGGGVAPGTTADGQVVVTASSLTCIPVGATVTFAVTKVSDPGLFDGTIGLGKLLSILAKFNLTTPGNWQVVGGGKMTDYPSVDRVDATGAVASVANGCAIDLNAGTVTFGPGKHKTRLYGNASAAVGTKLTFDYLDFANGSLETRYELTVSGVQTASSGLPVR
jgi:hypothetical protein